MNPDVPPAAQQQAAIILEQAHQMLPRCTKLSVFQMPESPGRWFLYDKESDLWWEAIPGGTGLDAEGYRRPDTVAFKRVNWDPRRTEDEVIGDEMAREGFLDGW